MANTTIMMMMMMINNNNNNNNKNNIFKFVNPFNFKNQKVENCFKKFPIFIDYRGSAFAVYRPNMKQIYQVCAWMGLGPVKHNKANQRALGQRPKPNTPLKCNGNTQGLKQGDRSNKLTNSNPSPTKAGCCRTPRCHGLTRKITMLNQFIWRLTNKYLHVFTTLRKAFEWIEKCEEAFHELNRYLRQHPQLNNQGGDPVLIPGNLTHDNQLGIS